MSISKSIKVIDPHLLSGSGNPMRDALGLSIGASTQNNKIENYLSTFTSVTLENQIKENLNSLGFLPIDDNLYTFKYATLKCRYLNSIKKTNFIVDDAI